MRAKGTVGVELAGASRDLSRFRGAPYNTVAGTASGKQHVAWHSGCRPPGDA